MNYISNFIWLNSTSLKKNKDTLHGGMLTALTDSVSTLALDTNEKKPSKSASVELSVS